MKGNQGLEALAALCGGRPAVEDGGVPSADAASSAANGTGTASSTPSRGSPQDANVSSEVAAKATTSAGIANASALPSQNHASEPTSAGGITKQIQQQVTVGAPLPIGTDPSIVSAAPVTGGLTPQQIQVIMAQSGRFDPALAAQSLLYPTALRGAETVATPAPVTMVPASANNILASTMQQLALQQYLQAQTNAAQQQQQQAQAAQAAATVAATTGHPQAALLAMNLAGKTGQLLPTAAPTIAVATNTNTGGNADLQRSSQQAPGSQQQPQGTQAQALLQHAAQQQQFNPASFAAIKPAKAGIHQHAQALQQQYHFQNSAPVAAGAASTLPSMIKMAAVGGRILPSTDIAPQNPLGTKTDGGDSPGSKKQQKRAANRKSAQLSRKRKKQFIEELKEENDDLKRKEQILRAIPDLIVVFDSSGRLGFVSESVGRFLDVSPDQMVGTSFWDLICEESVRMLKAAFMDSLAAREVDSDTAMLGSGVWELRLKDKNSKYTVVTLNGVVHFKGDAPECVCCIRPLSEEKQLSKQKKQQAQAKKQKQSPKLKSDGLENGNNAENSDGAEKPVKNNVNRAVSCSDGDASRSSDGSNRTQQSVLNMLSAQQEDAAVDAKKRSKKFRRVMASAADGDSSSNNDSDNNNNVEADGTNNSIRISDGDSNDGIESD